MSDYSDRSVKRIEDASSALIEASGTGPVARWVWGVVAPTAVVACAIWFVVRGSTPLPDGWTRLRQIRGGAGAVLAGAYIMIGAFIHVHFFWSAHEKHWRVARIAKYLIITAFILCILTLSLCYLR